MDNKQYNSITNLLVLLAIACVLAYDHLGMYKIWGLTIGLCLSLVGTILYFERYWKTSADSESLINGQTK